MYFVLITQTVSDQLSALKKQRYFLKLTAVSYVISMFSNILTEFCELPFTV
jgi:hypothetical protein